MTVQDVFDKAIRLMDEQNESTGATVTTDTKEYMDVVEAHSEQVGDVKVTRRTNLGNDWLLCNGEQFDDTVYPDLAAMYSKIQVLRRIKVGVTNCRVKYVNGYWVLFSRGSNQGTSVSFAYTTTPKVSSSWVTVTITTSNTTNCITDICYGNGYYLISGVSNTGTSTYPTLWYSTTIDTGFSIKVFTPIYQNPTNSWVSVANGRIFMISGAYIYSGTTPTTMTYAVQLKESFRGPSTINNISRSTNVVFFNGAYRFIATVDYIYSNFYSETYAYVSTDGVSWDNGTLIYSDSTQFYPGELFTYSGYLYAISAAYSTYAILKSSSSGTSFSSIKTYAAVLSIFQGKEHCGIITKNEASSTAGAIKLALYNSMAELLTGVNNIGVWDLLSNTTITVDTTLMNNQYLAYSEGVDMIVQIASSGSPGLYTSLVGNDPYGFVTPTLTDTGVYNYIRGKLSCWAIPGRTFAISSVTRFFRPLWR